MYPETLTGRKVAAMNRMPYSVYDSRGFSNFSWLDISPWQDGQIMSFPDYLYGIVIEIKRRGASDAAIQLRTTDGTVEVKLGLFTSYIDCRPADIIVGKRVVIAVKPDDGNIAARKVIVFVDS
jgi:hypothetical protein